MKSFVMEILPDVWPMIIIISVIIVSFRIAYLLKGRKKINFYDEILTLIFIIYILCLFHVVSYQDVNYGNNNFVPFSEIFRYSFGSYKFIRNVLGNIILFIPYGFFASYYLKSKKIYIPTLLTLIGSVTIETVQYYIGRVFDIDDIILNILGGILGYFVYKIIEKLREKIGKLFKGEGIFNLVIIIIIALIIIYAFNINVFFWLD